MTYKDMDEYIVEKLSDPEEAEAYLNAALDDYFEYNDKEAFSNCLKNLVKARCSVSKFSEECNVNRTHLYDIFNNQVNPQLDTLKEIFNVLGYTLHAKKKSASESAKIVDKSIVLVKDTDKSLQAILLVIDRINECRQNLVKSIITISDIYKKSAHNIQDDAAAEEQNASMQDISRTAQMLSRMIDELTNLISKIKL